MYILKKAQAEIALILGLLVIAAVVGIYSYSTLTPSTDQVALTQEQRAVAAYVNDFVRQASLETLSEIYGNGGYLDGTARQLGYVENKGFGEVAYWQMCENYETPDVATEFSNGVKEYIMENLPETQSIGGKAATFTTQGMVVSTKLYDNKVLVSANIPTTYEGLQIPQPYIVEVSTSLGRITDFASNLARMQSECRMFDLFLMESLMQSSEQSDPCWIPYGMGNAKKDYTFTWSELRDCMELHARYSLSHTKLGYEVPTNEDGQIDDFTYRGWRGSSLEFFFIPAVLDYKGVPDEIKACGGTPILGDVIGSDRYLDLVVQFYFGDDDGLGREEFSAPERLEIKRRQGDITQYLQGMVLAEYSAAYSVKYPVIVSVWDESVGRPFTFATEVFVESNNIGKGCTSPPTLPEAEQSGYSRAYNEICMSRATEDANVRVTYSDGSPVPGALVYFDGCLIGNTGSGQLVSGKIPPTHFGALRVSVDGNDYTKSLNYAALSSTYVFNIPRSRNYDFHLYKVPVSKSGGTYTAGTPVSVNGERTDVFMERTDPDIFDTSGTTSFATSEETFDVTRLPDYEYTVTTILRNSGGTLLGSLNTTGFVPSSTTEDIYIYTPSMSGFDEGTDMENIRNLYEKCGLLLISNGPNSSGGCSWPG